MNKPRQWPLAAFWFAINFQQAALITIVVPTALDRITRISHTAALARLVTVGDLLALIAPPLAGALSDRLRLRGGQRKHVLLAGAGVDMAGLAIAATAPGLARLTAGVLLAVLGMSAAGAAYQALMPEVVRAEDWGLASGYMGVSSLVGNAAGLVLAGLAPSPVAYGAMILVAGGGAVYTGYAVHEPKAPPAHDPRSERPHRPRAFYWVFSARFLVLFGQTVLMTYILYFFQDVLHVERPAASTAALAVLALLGASLAAWRMGMISNRANRATIVVLATLPMALATLAFGVTRSLSAIDVLAVIYGMGYGAFLSVDWALALDTMPDMTNVARNLGVWGMAAGLPAVIAPAIGGVILTHAGNAPEGYRTLFWVAGSSIAAGAAVLFVWAHPPKKLLTLAVAFPVAHTLALAVRLSARVRVLGDPVPRLGGTLMIANHQSDLDSLFLPAFLYTRHPCDLPPVSIGSARLFERRFLGVRAPGWLRWAVYWIGVGPILRLLQVLPIEDGIRLRPLTSWVEAVAARHGNLPASTVFESAVLERLGPGAASARIRDFLRLGWLARTRVPVPVRYLREPYRLELQDAVRRDLDAQMRAIRAALQAGQTVYLTPEGRLTTNGEIGRFRGVMDQLRDLLPAVNLYCAAIAYDPLRRSRIGMVCHLVKAPAAGDLRTALAGLRPLTRSHLVARALGRFEGTFTLEALVGAMRQDLRRVPSGAFVDPELATDLRPVAKEALKVLAHARVLIRSGAGYRMIGTWRHPWFPQVPDLLAYLRRQWDETQAASAATDAPLAAGPPGIS